MFSESSVSTDLLLDALNTVQTCGEPIVCPTLSLLGDLETLVKEVRRRHLRIAAFPSGGVTIFPIIPLDDAELMKICEEYCRIESDVARASMRYNLYLRAYPMFDSQPYSRDALYHPADSVLRLAELCHRIVRMPESNIEKLVTYIPYLHIDQIKNMCNAIYVSINAHDPKESNSAPPAQNSKFELFPQGIQTSLHAKVEDVPGQRLRNITRHSGLLQADAIEPTKSTQKDIQDDLTGQEMVDETSKKVEYLSQSEYELITSKSIFYYGEGHKKRLAAVYVPGGIDVNTCQAAASVLEPAATRYNMRAATNGGTSPETGIVGYYDYLNNPTRHKCRQTQFTRKNLYPIMDRCKDLMQCLDNLYRHCAPMYYNLQRIAIPRHFELFGTVFSTITVNRNFRTAVHRDKGDFRCGLGVLCVIDGVFDGCHLAIKALNKAFRLKVGDVLLFDTSLEHGNTEFLNHELHCKRISVVCYLRNGLMSSVCEFERHKHLNRVIADKLKSSQMVETVVNLNGVDEALPPLFVPVRLANKLSPVQLSALNFAIERGKKNIGCVLAMAMGIGKTLVGLTLSFSYFFRFPNRDILVLAPKPIINHWLKEQKKWEAYGLRFNHIIASDRIESAEFEESLHLYERQLRGDEKKEVHLIIINPEYLKSFSKRFKGFDPQLIVVDEGHRVAAKGNKLIESLSKYSCPLRVVLSGTPLQNNTKELYRLISWVSRDMRKVLPEGLFDEFANDISEYVDGDDSAFERAVVAQQFIQDWMKGFVFREMRTDLPPLYDYILICNSSKTQQLLESKMIVPSNEGIMRANEHRPSHLWAHPLCYLAFIMGGYHSLTASGRNPQREEGELYSSDTFSDVERYYEMIQNEDIDLFTASSGKLSALIKIVQQVQAKGEKVIIFSQYIGVQDIIHRTLTAYKIPTFTVRGRDSQDRRQHAIHLFSENTALVVLVVSTKIAAFGLDFTAANHVILFDAWWNPQVDAQAVARAYRRNQQKPVTVYRLASQLEGSSILRMQMRKMALFNCIMHEKTSRSAHPYEIQDCMYTGSDSDSQILWRTLRQTLLEGGYPVLECVYLYRDTVKNIDFWKAELEHRDE